MSRSGRCGVSPACRTGWLTRCGIASPLLVGRSAGPPLAAIQLFAEVYGDVGVVEAEVAGVEAVGGDGAAEFGWEKVQ